MIVKRSTENLAIAFGVFLFIMACALMVRGEEPPSIEDEIATCTYLTVHGERDVYLQPAIELVLDMNQAVYNGAMEAAIELGLEVKGMREKMIAAEEYYSCVASPFSFPQIAYDLNRFCAQALEKQAAGEDYIDAGMTTFAFLYLSRVQCQRQYNAFWDSKSPRELMDDLAELGSDDPEI